jgi:small GTP-binding protein
MRRYVASKKGSLLWLALVVLSFTVTPLKYGGNCGGLVYSRTRVPSVTRPLITACSMSKRDLPEEGHVGSDAAVVAMSHGSSAVVLPDYMLKILTDMDDTNGVGDKKHVVESELPIIAVIGRPNTGKSTLVNKIAENFQDGAIVSDEAGITRDRTYRVATWEGYNFQVVDTGGIVFDDKEGLFAEQITQQALQALQEAKAAILVCDGQIGVHPLDGELARWLRRHCKIPVYVAVNKCESHKLGNTQACDFWTLGLGEPNAISSIHGSGVGELLDKLITHIEKVDTPLKENSTNVAFIGRPNVGKSSVFNRLLGKQRAIVSEIAGTTRDTVDAVIYRGTGTKEKTYRIVDTAGIRRKGKIEFGSEFFMINRFVLSRLLYLLATIVHEHYVIPSTSTNLVLVFFVGFIAVCW